MVHGQVRRRRLVAGLVVAAVTGLTLVACSSPPRDASAGRSRAYSAFEACLLTGPGGVSGPAAPAWAGMEDASATTHAKVSWLAVTGPQTEANAATFVGALVVRQCRVILAMGDAELAAVAASAGRFPSVQFALLAAAGGPVAGSGKNVVMVAGDAAQLRSRVASLVASAAGS